ncbi:hypothetical protein ACWGCW_27965 [Streptomyces sp. NPDC054933]
MTHRRPGDGGLWQGWPFAVGRTVHHGHRAMVVPEPYATHGMPHLLEDAVGAGDSGSLGGTWAHWATELPSAPLLLVRSFTVPDPHRPGQTVHDDHSRPIRLYYGLAVPRFMETAVPGPVLVSTLRALATDYFRQAVERETPNEPWAPAVSAPMPLAVDSVHYAPAEDCRPDDVVPSAATRSHARQRSRQPNAIVQEIVRALTGRRAADADADTQRHWAVHLLELDEPRMVRAIGTGNGEGSVMLPS